MVRPPPARATPRRRATTLTVVALALLGLSGCGVAASNPTRSGAGMMGGGAAAVGPGGGAMMSGRLTCTAPAPLPGSEVTVSLVDMGMTRAALDPAPLGIAMRLRTSTSSVPAGEVTLVAQNLGRRTHELVVLPLAAGQQPGTRAPGSDGRVAETGSVGEASNPCHAGSGDGLVAGTSGWVTLTLAPGRYELVCNEANHNADGMWAELDVS